MKTVLVESDPHCGHKYGLTPPDWWRQTGKKWDTYHRQVWKQKIQSWKDAAPIDRVIHCGDVIDGRGDKSGGTELISTDPFDQINIFLATLKEMRPYLAKKSKLLVVFGTAYHTTFSGSDAERVITKDKGVASLFDDVAIDSHGWYTVEGVTFDVKHHVGRSALPHGRATPLLREALYNELWHIDGLQPRASVVLRGHTHYFCYAGDRNKIAMTCPCSTWGSKFGTRRCSETIDWGNLWFRCDKGRYDWGWNIKFADVQHAKAVQW